MKKSLLGVSLLTLTSLYCFFFAFIFFIGLFIGAEISYVILASIIVLIIQFLLAPYITDLVMKLFYGAKFDVQIPEHLVSFITVICTQNKMKYPKIGYIDDGAPNAFTYGRTKNDARIIITRGLIEMLSVDELEAVVSHEIGHAVHYDMFVMTMAQLIPLILYYCFELFTKNNDDSDNSKLAIFGYIAYVLYLISDYIILWLSRQREYFADSFAIEATRNPSALAEALVKIGYGLSTRSDRQTKNSVSNKNALGIFDSNVSKSLVLSSYGSEGISKDTIMQAMKWEMWNVWAKWYELSSTHPMVSKRLKAISERCVEFNQSKYIDFNFQKTESYVDDFVLELFILCLPLLVIIWGVILLIVGGIFISKFDYFTCLWGILASLMVAYLIKLSVTHKNKNYKSCTVLDLLSEVKVSGVTSVPCEIEGEIIGRGVPGCIFNEDFVIKDTTGIMFLDYKHVFRIMDKFVALFKNNEFMNKKIKVTGWYRRNPVPYIEIYKLQIEGESKERVMKSFAVSRFLAISVLIFSIIMMFI